MELPEKPHRTWGDVSAETRIWTAKDSETYQGEETIVIPENVTQIEDYAFSNCAGLKQIVLEQKDPSKCIVGQHLLDGTGAEILVPQMSVDSYKRNYFWSVYAGRIGKLLLTQKNKPTTFKRNLIWKIMIQCRYDKSETINFEL